MTTTIARARQQARLSDITTTEDLTAWTSATPRSQRRQQLLALSNEDLTALWRSTDTKTVSVLLASIDPRSTAEVLQGFSRAAAGRLLSRMTEQQAADVLRVLGPEAAEPLRSALPTRRRLEVDQLLMWPADSAGANMTPNFLWLPGRMPAGEGIAALRVHAQGADATAYIYILEEDGGLLGVLSFRELITAAPEASLAEVANKTIATAPPTMDREDAAAVLHEHDLTALPVTEEGVLRGVITADRAAEIMAVETTEDFRRMSSAGGLTTSLKDASIWLLYRSRIGWLVVLIFGNLFSGAGIAYYEDLIEQVVALVFFLPLLIDSGGNAGSQSATLMVRALATGEVQLRDWAKMLGKELLIALLLGLTMAVAVSFVGVARGGAEVGLVVALTMVAVVIVGSTIGMLLPFVLTKLRLDPASASAPLITTICDGLGVLIYFFIASQLLL